VHERLALQLLADPVHEQHAEIRLRLLSLLWG
jgi:hypothetical protein